MSIEFEEVSRTASSVTYRAESWEAEYSGTSNWDDIDGTITFRLKK
ncbi:hypothetical protein [Nocardioides sp. TF02-7]|nr:hypothetical protein [Nocardioides sp. TF02-7]UMG94349.1 hypothetical protein MF408_10295 [Nocardioides sp. TF02-7]